MALQNDAPHRPRMSRLLGNAFSSSRWPLRGNAHTFRQWQRDSRADKEDGPLSDRVPWDVVAVGRAVPSHYGVTSLEKMSALMTPGHRVVLGMVLWKPQLWTPLTRTDLRSTTQVCEVREAIYIYIYIIGPRIRGSPPRCTELSVLLACDALVPSRLRRRQQPAPSRGFGATADVLWRREPMGGLRGIAWWAFRGETSSRRGGGRRTEGSKVGITTVHPTKTI